MRHVLFLFLVLVLALPVLAGERAPLEHRLSVRLDPAEHRIEATDRLRLPAGEGPVVLHLARELAIESATRDGREVAFERRAGAGRTSAWRIEAGDAAGEAWLEVRYGGELHQDASGTKFSREAIGSEIDATIGPEGVFLSPGAAWYPRPAGDELARFRVEVSSPAGLEALCEGARIERSSTDEGTRVVWETEMPLDGVHLVAGPYDVVERSHGRVALYAYVYGEDRELAGPYLDDVARYLDLYVEMLGPYPFAKFAVVESFFPSGYGMPSFTYLGREVMRLPFIRQTSLGHEVLHNWWGNSVLVDASEGNWCEGLTTYLADHLYEERASREAGRDHRRRTLADYASYVSEAKDAPLSAFRARHDAATRSIGYGKGLMVWHMLRARFGEDRFVAALRRVVRERTGRFAGWRHFRRAFEEETGRDLGWFFERWVERPGAPRVVLADASTAADETGERRVRVALTAEPAGRLLLPVELRPAAGEPLRRVVDAELGSEPRVFEWLLPDGFEPVEVAVDPDFDSMRLLDPAEIPATLRLAFGAEDLIAVLPDGASEAMTAAYRRLAEGLSGRLRLRVVEAADLPDGMPGPAAIVFGTPAESRVSRAVFESLGPAIRAGGGEFRVPGTRLAGEGALLVACARTAPDRVAVVVCGATPGAVEAAGYKIVHYGRYGHLLFDAGTNVAKGVTDSPSSPLVKRLRP